MNNLESENVIVAIGVPEVMADGHTTTAQTSSRKMTQNCATLFYYLTQKIETIARKRCRMNSIEYGQTLATVEEMMRDERHVSKTDGCSAHEDRATVERSR